MPRCASSRSRSCSRRTRPRRAAGRRSLALHRCALLLERLDDPRLTPSDDREVRRRLREEITVLWRTSDLRAVAPTPLDEVRTAMAFFDATIFTLVPGLYRGLDGAVDPPTVAPPRGRADGRRADRHAAAAGAAVPALGELDRRRPRRQPRGHRRRHRADLAHPRRPRAPRLRGGRHPADADRLRGRRPGSGVAPARAPARPRRRPAARDRPPAAPAVPRRAVPPAVRVHRRAAASHPGGA